jgi:hypothetical protein
MAMPVSSMTATGMAAINLLANLGEFMMAIPARG